jgi:hypothetical protein
MVRRFLTMITEACNAVNDVIEAKAKVISGGDMIVGLSKSWSDWNRSRTVKAGNAGGVAVKQIADKGLASGPVIPVYEYIHLFTFSRLFP